MTQSTVLRHAEAKPKPDGLRRLRAALVTGRPVRFH